MQDLRRQFEADGFVAPVRVLSGAQAAALVRSFAEVTLPTPAVWEKGRWINDRRLFDLATGEALRDLVCAVLGADVVLWGAEILLRREAQRHPWHVDIESAAPEGGFASVWIGLENTSRESALQVISGSHRFGEPIQKVARDQGYRRGEVDEATALAWARKRSAEAVLVEPDLSDGEAILFDGRLWHGSNNRRPGERRMALLLQYARADRKVRIPDLTQLEWPFADRGRPRAPVIAVGGVADPSINWVVKVKAQPDCSTHALTLPLARDLETGWKAHPIFTRATPVHGRLSVHASVLEPGRCPHPPHLHDEEEFLIVLDGEAQLVMQNPQDRNDLIFLRAGRGAAMYYPSNFAHTIRNASDQPITYLMLKWAQEGTRGQGRLQPAMINTMALPRAESDRDFVPRLMFQEATRHLGLLHCHVTDLKPGAAVAPHVDSHDAAILVLAGEIEVVGRRVRENGIAYAAAGELHGFANPGTVDARYLVLEFHGRASGAAAPVATMSD